MIVKLLAAHYFTGDLYYDATDAAGNPVVLGTPQCPLPPNFMATHEMEGVDDEGKAAVAEAIARWGKGPLESLPATVEEGEPFVKMRDVSISNPHVMPEKPKFAVNLPRK